MRKANCKNKSYYHYTVITYIEGEELKKYYFTRQDIINDYFISDFVIRKYLTIPNYKSRQIQENIKIIKEKRPAYRLVQIVA